MKTSPGNRRHPRRYLAALPLGACLLAGCMALSPEQQTTLDLMNHDRQVHHLSSLPAQADSQAKAQAWAEQLAKDGYLHHSRLQDGIHAKWCSLGENIGTGASSGVIETAYMNSPHHRDNILDTAWNGAGMGYAKVGNRVYTVQEFIKTC